MSNQIVKHQMRSQLQNIGSINSFEDLVKVSQIFVASGLFKDLQTQAQAAVKIFAGNSMGINPFTAVSQIYVISGKIVMSASLQAACLKSSGRYNYKVLEKTDKVCSIEFFEKWDGKWESMGVETYTWDDAVQAKLTGKDVWKSYPKNMLFSRCIVNGIRTYAPDVMGQSVYDAEELTEVRVDSEGNTVPVNAEIVETYPAKLSSSKLPFNTPDEALKWVMTELHLTEEEATEFMASIPPDASGKKSRNLYEEVLRQKEELNKD